MAVVGEGWQGTYIFLYKGLMLLPRKTMGVLLLISMGAGISLITVTEDFSVHNVFGNSVPLGKHKLSDLSFSFPHKYCCTFV